MQWEMGVQIMKHKPILSETDVIHFFLNLMRWEPLFLYKVLYKSNKSTS